MTDKKKKKKVVGTSFTTQRKTLPVTIDGNKYILREYGGVELSEYQTELSAATKFTDDGKPAGVQLAKDAPLRYLSRGLFRVNEDGTTGLRVAVEILRGWGAEVIDGLTFHLRELNGQTPEAEEEVGKESDGTEATETGSE